jgi:hypothetical protein
LYLTRAVLVGATAETGPASPGADLHEDYDAEIGMDFGIADAGVLFICVPKADLLAMRFDRVIGFAQSH